MKKSLIALAILGASTDIASAQSNVTLYGIVDTGLIKETGTDVRMGSNVKSRLGFRGVEDLGSGIKATFELERRFDLNDGTQSTTFNYDDLAHSDRTIDWRGAANVGLKSDLWGAVRLGRVNDLSVETYRLLDPFNQYGVGASLAKTPLYSEQLSNTVRYDSTNWKGFSFGASYSLGADDHDNIDYQLNGNDGFAVNLKYDNGPLLLLANYDRLADSNKSWLWNAGAAYQWQNLTVSLGYQDSTFKLQDYDEDIGEIDRYGIKQKNWLVGLQYKTGPHTVSASCNYGRVKSEGNSNKVNKYALGYTYSLSKRTSLYANIAYSDFDNEWLSNYYRNDMAVMNDTGNETANASVTGIQIGITHRF